MTEPTVDPSLLVRSATGALAAFNRAGVLGPADVHTAVRIARIAGDTDEDVALALALTVRALRGGSVCLDLDTVADLGLAEGSEDEVTGLDVELPWPALPDWVAACARSSLVVVGPDGDGDRPLRLVSPGQSPGDPAAATPSRLYLQRYWEQEEQIRTQLQRRRALPPPTIDPARLAAGLDRLFRRTGLDPDEADWQRTAAAVSVFRRVTVVAGGPGTGKTTTVARLLALLADQYDEGERPPRIALAAPTGKAAARLSEAVRSEVAKLPAADQRRLGLPAAVTLDRLLGWLPGRRYRHHAGQHLPYDVLVVDETSMVSLTMMARFLDAVAPQARIVLVGDPDQLTPVEAGAVLADVVKAEIPADAALADGLGRVGAAPVSRPVVRLEHPWRFGGAIGHLAAAVRDGDADAAVQVLRRGEAGVVFVPVDAESATEAEVAALVDGVVQAGRVLWAAAQVGDERGALQALASQRLLCAHRGGPYGVARWSREIEQRLLRAVADPVALTGEWYPGRPLMITANDYDLQVYNGDTGVVVATDDGLRATFERADEPLRIPPVRLEAVQTLYAMTVHKAQGSQFETVSLVLPPPESRLLTRELLYTAITRASAQVRLYGTEEAVRQAVLHPARRATGLRERLA